MINLTFNTVRNNFIKIIKSNVIFKMILIKKVEGMLTSFTNIHGTLFWRVELARKNKMIGKYGISHGMITDVMLDSMAQWIRRWSTEPEILGSIPSGVVIFKIFFLIFLT